MSEKCGCCGGVGAPTPTGTANRPGLDALTYRAGTHATFLKAMKARLSSSEYPALAGLSTRDPEDPAIALLDAFAAVGDVLTFYTERIANEGYLRTATERRSIFELARLVGYEPRPGVSASVYLAFSQEDGYEGKVPAGTGAQSVPRPGELPQPFETAEDLQASAAWNALTPRLGRPQSMEQITGRRRVYFKGTDTKLGPNDPILFDLGPYQVFFRVESVVPDQDADRTLVTLQPHTATRPKDILKKDELRDELLELLEHAKGHLKRALAAVPDFDALGANATPLATSVRRLSDVLSKNLSRLGAQPELDGIVGDAGPEGSALGALQDFALGLGRLHAAAVEADNLIPEELADELAKSLDAVRCEIDGLWAIRALRPLAGDAPTKTGSTDAPHSFHSVGSLVPSLEVVPPASPEGEVPTTVPGGVFDLAEAFGGPGGAEVHPPVGRSRYSVTDASVMAFKAMESARGEALGEAMENVTARPDGPKIYAMRVTASPFGHNALGPGEPRLRKSWRLHESPKAVTLEGSYKEILPKSWVVFERPESTQPLPENGQISPEEPAPEGTIIAHVDKITERSRADYGITARSTEIATGERWIDLRYDRFDVIRSTSIHAQSEPLELAEAPLEEARSGWRPSAVSGNRIELDSQKVGLRAGRRLIVSGERENLAGVIASELVTLAGVEHGMDRTLPGDVMVSTLLLDRDLAYSYMRETVKVYANVARATHGETRTEVLGSGNVGEGLQRFELRQAPLTHLAAATPGGLKSTLKVFVNGVRWDEAETLARLGPTDRCYVTRTSRVGETADVEETTVLFGDGRHGARLPNGTENVRAEYRTGSGRAGNVAEGQISQLGATRPLGLSGVTNPLRATGGADREPEEGVKSNAPLATVALDRLVGTRDYEDFARVFGGIGKASATRFDRGPRSLVHLTIAGQDDVPIAEDSDLARNLLAALHRAGDPRQRIQVDTRDRELIFVSARVRLLARYLWAVVESEIRPALWRTLGFDRRELGQPMALSEVTGVIQRVPGVDYVDIETFGSVPERTVDEVTGRRLPLTPEQIAAHVVAESREPGHPQDRVAARLAHTDKGRILPARLAYLAPEVPQTLILREITA